MTWNSRSNFWIHMSICLSLTSNKASSYIDIYKPHKKFLGFSWEVGGGISYFVFTILPFGPKSAPFTFTKVMRCLVKHWRINAIRIACFLDRLGVTSSYKTTLFHSNFLRKSWQNADFIISEEKSVWKPSQTLIGLGIEINLINGFYSRKLSAIKNSLVLLIEKLLYTTARELAKRCRKLISTTSTYFGRYSQPLWDSTVDNENAIKELIFSKNNINYFNKKPLRVYDVPKTVHFSEASSF